MKILRARKISLDGLLSRIQLEANQSLVEDMINEFIKTFNNKTIYYNYLVDSYEIEEEIDGDTIYTFNLISANSFPISNT